METNSNSKGNYRKYADGTLEMWGTIPISSASITTKSGNIFISDGYTFVLPYTSLTGVSVSAHFISNTGAWLSLSTGGNNKSSVGYWLFLSVSSRVDGRIYFNAYGTWK